MIEMNHAQNIYLVTYCWIDLLDGSIQTLALSTEFGNIGILP